MASFPHLLRLIIAGILAIPALLLLITFAPIIVLLSIPSLAILVRRKRNIFPSFDNSIMRKSSSDSTNIDGKGHTVHPLLRHAVITGGSSGIGLSIAIELAKQRCRHITLLARNEQQLVGAKLLVEKAAAAATTTSSTTTTSVHILSVDVTDFSALEKAVANHISSSINNTATPGPPTLLFHCAGMSIPLAFEDLSASNFYKQMNVNYLGSVHVVKAFLPYMTNTTKQQQSVGGNIILTSSMSGQTGTFGYSGYSPTKFALRGFAECLSMELAAKKSNVNISLAYPPDTKTPGYEIENRNKPEECRLISEGSGIWDPDVVGKKMVDKALSSNPPFDIYFGIDGWMLSTLTSGMNPVTSLVDAIYQVSLMGLLRFISLFYLMDFGRITQNCHDAKEDVVEAEAKDTCKND